jgi:hypothetical protein
MNAMLSAEEITRRESTGSMRLWFGVLAAPIAWVVQLLVNYSLEEWFACAPSTEAEGEILGLSVGSLALLVTTVLAAVAVVGLLVSLGCRRALAKEDALPGIQRARWMAVAGIFNSILYLALIVASYGPPLLLGVCETSP